MATVSESVRQEGASVYVPFTDILMGYKFGYYDYDDYFDNSQPWLDVADAVFLVPGWETSTGTRREIERADKQGIPVFTDIAQLRAFLKPVIVCIVGESGSGKTLLAEWFEQLYNFHLIQSYTTRPRRSPEENGHTFISEQQFDKFIFDKEEMIAFTKFGEFRYCCLRKDVKFYNTYVIDEVGLKMLKEKYSNDFHIYSIRVHAKDRKHYASPERYERDNGRYNMKDSEFDFVYHNSYDLSELINFVRVTQSHIMTDFISNCQYE